MTDEDIEGADEDGLPFEDDPDEINFPLIADDGELTFTLSQTVDPTAWARALLDRFDPENDDEGAVPWLARWFANAFVAGARHLGQTLSVTRTISHDPVFDYRRSIGAAEGER